MKERSVIITKLKTIIPKIPSFTLWMQLEFFGRTLRALLSGNAVLATNLLLKIDISTQNLLIGRVTLEPSETRKRRTFNEQRSFRECVKHN
ncbi:hypothetical protein NPIL_503801 [Nephila pilipes]|uniref:Uncharacterized protein n=1 Tax=Nephila pilipes TaxID=299642 RepID=A0A8X6P6Q7_NEPPI|nr:hypothetical protein NPIL_503801 [Nephila pilipes]